MSREKDIKIQTKLFYVKPNWEDTGQAIEAANPKEAVDLVVKEHGYELESDDSFKFLK